MVILEKLSKCHHELSKCRFLRVENLTENLRFFMLTVEYLFEKNSELI